MEKEVKKTRKKKVDEEVKPVQEEVVETSQTASEKAEKKAKKTRVKKAKKTEEVAQEVVEVAVEVDATKTEEESSFATENVEEKVEEKPKKVKKTRAKQAKKEESSLEAKPAEEKKEMTRAEKKDAVRAIVKELLEKGNLRRGALIDEASKKYVEKYPSTETVNVNDVKGRVGSVITLMEQAKEVFFGGNEMTLQEPIEKVVAEKEEKEAEPVPAPVKEEFLPVPAPESKLAPVFDLSALLGEKAVEKAKKAEKKLPEKAEEKAQKLTEKSAEKVEKKAAKKSQEKPEKTPVKKGTKKGTEDKLKEKFLKKIRSHGGSYLEYYAIYLLQRYAQANGRRLEGLRVCGGKADGGIDGEIEVSDRFGFRETLYIQAKNWEPTDEKWVVGETLLQQFIGAVTYRMVQSGKTHGRGVYVTTSKFSEGAKKMLDDLSEKYVGYDGDDLFDLAKECRFGLLEKDGEWTLDDNLLAGEKAFFNM